MLANANTKYLVVAGFLLAGILAAGVWFVDFGFLDPAPITRPDPDSGSPGLTREEEPWYVPGDWTPLAGSLEELREPVVRVAQEETEVDVEPPPPPPPVERRLPPLADTWKYKGYILVGGSLAALVEFGDGEETFIFTGMQLPDDANPGGGVRIVEILPDRIVLDRGLDSNEDLPRHDPEARAAAAATPATPVGAMTPGSRF